MKTVDPAHPRKGRRTQKVTLKDVADAAGVSMMTVSNVLHGRSNVSAALREQVQGKIAELGYVPNRAAQELAGVSRPHIGLLYPAVINPFLAAVIVGAMRAAQRLRVDVSVQLAQLDDSKSLRATMAQMEEGGVDGFLLPSPIAEFAAATFKKKPLDRPAVALAPGFPLPGMASVRCDEEQAARDLVRLLIGLGHRQIGHLAGPETQSGSIARKKGYEQTMRDHGLMVTPGMVVQSTAYRFQEGLAAAEKLLDLLPRPTAVFAANDTLAAAVVAAAQRRGLSVPHDLSVVGYDDSPIAEQVWPGLTTIHQDAAVMTEHAVDLLNAGIRAWRADPASRLADDVVFPYSLVTRGSCAPPA